MTTTAAQHTPTLLTIAGSDSIGGAGIQADIKTAETFGVYAMSVITALTAQNTTGIEAVFPVMPSFLDFQINAVLSDVTPDAIKIGMISTVQCAEVIALALKSVQTVDIVVDPIAISTSGTPLSENIQQQADLLFPLALIVTPNIPEAELLLNRKVYQSKEGMAESARSISARYGAKNVLLKGGHQKSGEMLTDALYLSDKDKFVFFSHTRIDSRNTHGTGCILSSAIACGLANGLNVEDSVGNGIKFLHDALQGSVGMRFGHGKGSPCLTLNSNIKY